MALTSTASGGNGGAAARSTPRKPCDGTATITWRAPSSASASDAVGSQRRGKRDVRQIRRIRAPRGHLGDQRRGRGPTASRRGRRCPGEWRAPCPSFPRPAPRPGAVAPDDIADNSTGPSERLTEHLERGNHRLLAHHRRSPAKRTSRAPTRVAGARCAITTVPTGFFGRPASRAGDAGDAHAGVGAEPPRTPSAIALSDRLAHRAVRCEQLVRARRVA